jgi:hypothetical protein
MGFSTYDDDCIWIIDWILQQKKPKNFLLMLGNTLLNDDECFKVVDYLLSKQRVSLALFMANIGCAKPVHGPSVTSVRYEKSTQIWILMEKEKKKIVSPANIAMYISDYKSVIQFGK